MDRHFPHRIVSGGQTGADRGGLEAAIELGIPHGGWCPLGRRAEDGRIPARFELREAPSEVYAVRTRWNVRDSDATLLLTKGEPTGGSAMTAQMATKMGRPLLHIDLLRLSKEQAAHRILDWLLQEKPGTLNVAGSRESISPGLARDTREILTMALSKGEPSGSS